MGRILLLVLSSVLLLVSCIHHSSTQSETVTYDTTTNTLLIPTDKLAYSPPFPEQTIVASATSLPENILMCVVDTLSQISVTLINLDTTIDNLIAAHNAVMQITNQPNEITTLSLGENITECTFMDYDSWNFNKNLGLIIGSDTMRITYSGYLFKKLAIVATAPTDSTNSDVLNTYINCLRRTK